MSMAERERRSILDRFRRSRRASTEDMAKVGELLGGSGDSQNIPLDWDIKTLASMSKIGQATGKRGGVAKDSSPSVPYTMLREISLKSEVVNAILRRTVDDCLGNGYEFILPPDREEGSKEQLESIKQFFKTPNPDDNGNEWLESLIYDLALFGDAYLELDGSADKSDKQGDRWNFGGELVSVWPIPAEQMKLLPGNKRPMPPKMAYEQNLNGQTRQFDSAKIIHVSKFKHGRAYGTSPLIPLLNVIAGHLNLSNYLNELYTGTLPKTILNVGDISNSEMKAMLGLLEQQLSGGKSPFGLVAVNGGSGFTMHRILDSTREGAQLDLLYYYREEICAVFGIPPMKLGWVQTGKLSNPESQLEAWYDVVDSFHRRIEAVINNRLMPLLGITDWVFNFVSIRPSREAQMAEMRNKDAAAISNLRQESVISINEARNFLGLERLDMEDADDPMFLSPKLSINKGKVEGGGSEEAPEQADLSLSDIFPPPDRPTDEGKGAGEFPIDTIPVDLTGTSDDIRLDIKARRTKRSDEFDALMSKSDLELLEEFNDGQTDFAESVIRQLDAVFADGDEAVVEEDPDLNIPVKGWIRKRAISIGEIERAVIALDTTIEDTIGVQALTADVILTDTYGASMDLTLGGTGIAAALNADDIAALAYWRSRWTLPALRNTLGGHRESIIGVFEQMIERGESWRWAKNEMRSRIDPSGAKYPAYYYERIARTETRRVVENSHIAGMKRAGFDYVQRLVVVDDRTDRDLCAPYEDAIYSISESRSVIPAHPNCRCTMTAYDGPPPEEPETPRIPDVEGAERSKAVSESVRSTLANKAKEHNEKVKNQKTKKTTTRTLVAVFERGVGAYQTNPGSVRPTVSSAEQWAYARVNSFLYALRNGRFRGGKHDTDLLPKGHPQSTKAAQGSLSVGDFVGWTTDKGPYVGKIKSIRESGSVGGVATSEGGSETIEASPENQVAIVQVYIDNEDGSYSASDRDAPVRVAMLRKRDEPAELKRALTTKDRTPPQGVRTACRRGIELHEQGYSGDGLEPATVREAKAIARGEPITDAKARKMIRWWGRNERFLDEPKDSPAWTAAMLWGGRPGLSWSQKLRRAIEADD